MAGESFPDAKAQVAAEVTGKPPMLLKNHRLGRRGDMYFRQAAQPR
jgi:hypothetical protein